MPAIQLSLLGQFHVRCDNESVTALPQSRTESLLAYLALHQRAPLSRQHLAFLFWPDASEAQAFANLRKQLLYLRRTLPGSDRLLQIDAKMVQWQPFVSIELDVEQFELALTTAKTLNGVEAIAAFQQVITLYHGDLLPGHYDEWLLGKREELRKKYAQSLERLLVLLENQRQYMEAIAIGHQLLQHDPLHESVYLRLMRLYALQNDRAAALNVYRTCVRALQRELQVEPASEIQQAYESLLNHQIPLVAHTTTPSAPDAPTLVGRVAEWQLLQTLWHEVVRGHAHLLMIVGEAGIGKSRLAEELLEWAQRQGVLAARARAYAAEGQLAYAPVIDWLRTPSFKSRLARLDNESLADVARLLPELLHDRPALPLSHAPAASWQRHRLFEALTHAILVDQQPILLVLDDLQWCDQETLAWLHFLLRFAPQAKLLVVATVRLAEVGLQHPLVSLLLSLRHTPQLTELELGALGVNETAQLAQQLVGRSVDSEWARRLYLETEGHPLYIVEMVQAHLHELQHSLQMWLAADDSGAGRESMALPPRIQSVIDARLAQLSPLARNVADLAAVLGRDFSFEVLTYALDAPEDEVVSGLDELIERQFVRERGRSGYDFSHDKLREAIYAKVSGTRRRLLHRRVAQALEKKHTLIGDFDQVSSQIATHFDKGDLPERAIPAYARAAQIALHVHAYPEARDLFQRAISLINELPSTPERMRQELDLLLRLGTILVALHGYGFGQVRETYLRAHSLIQALDEPSNPAILRALALFYLTRREYSQAHEQGEQLCTLAETADEPTATVLTVEGHYVLGVTAFWRGEFVQSKEHLELALCHYDVQYHDLHTTLFTQDPGVVCRIRLAFTLWFLGFPDQAQQHCTAALSLARSFGHPFSLAYALNFAAWFYTECGDRANATATISELLPYCEKHSLRYWQPIGLVLQGYGLATQGQIDEGMARIRGQIDEGIAHIRAGMQAYQVAVLELYEPYTLAVLAQVYALAGVVDQAIALLDEALASVMEYRDPWYHAEMLRIKGNLLRQQGAHVSVVESHYQQALVVAQNQQSHSLALRAAMSLSELWYQQGKSKRARRLLTSVYRSFNEGFGTADLQAAQLLLEKLK